MQSELIGRAEQEMTKTFIADYGVDGKYPEADDLIDWTKVDAEGTQVYFYVGAQDYTCPLDISKRLAEEMPSFQRQYTYTCADHMHFVDTGVQNDRLHKDLVIVLGAKALAASAVAAIASMALF